MPTRIKKASIDGSSNKRKVKKNWFTGKVWMRSVSDIIGAEKHDIHHVHFESGARTKLHKHNGGQTLIVTKGKGSLEVFVKTGRKTKQGFGIRRTKTVNLAAGDTVHIPAGVLHTHGSVSEDETFSHIVINLILHKNREYKTDWYGSNFKDHVFEQI